MTDTKDLFKKSVFELEEKMNLNDEQKSILRTWTQNVLVIAMSDYTMPVDNFMDNNWMTPHKFAERQNVETLCLNMIKDKIAMTTTRYDGANTIYRTQFIVFKG